MESFEFMSYNIGAVCQDVCYLEKISATIQEMKECKNFFFWTSAKEFWRSGKTKRLDLLVIDSNLSDISGYELTRVIKIRNPEQKIILIGDKLADTEIDKVLRSGAVGYILKSDSSNLKQMMIDVIKGGGTLSPSLTEQILNFLNKPAIPAKTIPELSKREMEIVLELIKGHNSKEISQIFGTSEQTIRKQFTSIYRKLKVNSQAELLKKLRELNF